MKGLFASDIHGRVACARKLIEICKKENPDFIILLGDLLSHGIRAESEEYSTEKTAELLNSLSDKAVVVMGNCDFESDRLYFKFNMLNNYQVINLDEHRAIVTHGHNIVTSEFETGDILITGHTHISSLKRVRNYYHVNPGSVSLPRGGTKNGYMIYEDKEFITKDLNMNEIERMKIE